LGASATFVATGDETAVVAVEEEEEEEEAAAAAAAAATLFSMVAAFFAAEAVFLSAEIVMGSIVCGIGTLCKSHSFDIVLRSRNVRKEDVQFN
jgi:hypothetical protein